VSHIRPGQLLTTNNPDGIAVMRYNVLGEHATADPWAKLIKLAEDDLHGDVFRRIPVGEFFLCLEVVWSAFDEEDLCLNASMTVLWRENIYLLFCNAREVQAVCQ